MHKDVLGDASFRRGRDVRGRELVEWQYALQRWRSSRGGFRRVKVLVAGSHVWPVGSETMFVLGRAFAEVYCCSLSSSGNESGEERRRVVVLE